MKTKLTLFVAVIGTVLFGAGCGTTSWVSDPDDSNNIKIEAAIRNALKNDEPEGELTKVDLEKITELQLHEKRLTSLNGIEKLTRLTHLDCQVNRLTDIQMLSKLKSLIHLNINNNPDLSKAQIDQLQKVLPNCRIYSNPTK